MSRTSIVIVIPRTFPMRGQSQQLLVINHTATVYRLSADGYSADLSAGPLYGPTPVITDTVKRVPML